MPPDKLTGADLLKYRAYLPRRVNEMLVFFGVEATATLLNTYRGKTVSVSRGITQQGKRTNQHIINLIGEQAANRFCVFAVDYARHFPMPRCAALYQRIAYERITAEFDRMTAGSDGVSANHAANLLAERYGYSYRHILRILKQG